MEVHLEHDDREEADVPDLRPVFLDPEVSQVMQAFLRWKPKPKPWWQVRREERVHALPVDLGISLAEAADWAANDFSEVERDVWIAAGLRRREGAVAARCVAQGIRPSELRVAMHGRTALDYLRSGESVAQVFARLREAG